MAKDERHPPPAGEKGTFPHPGLLEWGHEIGYFRIYGRTKDLINRGGYKIYPYELESLIVQHPKVGQACVVATPNPVLGESICACIISKPGERVTLKELRAFLREVLFQVRIMVGFGLCLKEDLGTRCCVCNLRT